MPVIGNQAPAPGRSQEALGPGEPEALPPLAADEEVAEAGVDMFVAGSAIFRDPRTEEAYKKTIDAMRDELAAAKVPANKVAA